MLKSSNKNLYIYVVDRDFGFAPNPFHGYCTLATCKPNIRNNAFEGDWIMGVGGRRLKATGKCIFLMKVTEIKTFNEYWKDVKFKLKKPVRNGSPVMMVGDNIYHKDSKTDEWHQADSHHSDEGGSINFDNLRTDTKSLNVLISTHFYYFGREAPYVQLESIGYSNNIGHSKKSLRQIEVSRFLSDIESKYKNYLNMVLADPFNFDIASKRVIQKSGKIL